jgi:hypothetical protein
MSHNNPVIHRRAPFQEFVPVSGTAESAGGAQGSNQRKCAPRLAKTQLSTKIRAFYYYDYVFIEELRRRQSKKSGRRAIERGQVLQGGEFASPAAS